MLGNSGRYLVAVGRPEFDLENAGSIDRVVNAVLPWHRQCRSIHGCRHGRIGAGTRIWVNRDGAGRLAEQRDASIRLSMFPTDYVLMAAGPPPIARMMFPSARDLVAGLNWRAKSSHGANPDALVFALLGFTALRHEFFKDDAPPR